MSRRGTAKQKLKKELAEYFEAPAPEGKRTFVRQFGLQDVSLTRMVFMQARYLSPLVWLASTLMFGLAVGFAVIAQEKYVNVLYACVPFLVTLSVTEATRSYRHGMEELEMAARFSLKSILMARMLMLGVGNLVVLVVLLLLCRNFGQSSGAYVFTPYFLTAGGGLCIVRRVRGNESVFLCFALAALISGLMLYLPWQFAGLFDPEYALGWTALCGVGVFFAGREGYRTIRMAENCGE